MAILSGKVGGVVASTLHTAGALAFLGGLVAYVVWARAARRGARHPDLLVMGATITYVGILANLFGGFVRTYQPGHPSFWDFGTEPWATVMVVKHAFLFAGMGAAVYLYEVQAPRLAKTQVERVQRLEGMAVAGCAVAILAASILGAVAAVTPISGMAVDDGDGGPALPPPYLGDSYHFDGTITGLGPSPAPSTGAFDVGPGARGLTATLTTGQGASLTLTLRAPDGTSHADSTDGTQSEPSAQVLVDGPTAGRWTYAVSADTALFAVWELDVTVQGAVETFREDTVSLASGATVAVEFTIDAGATFVWDWSSSDHVEFSVARDGASVFARHTSGESGNITADEGATYRVAWQNQEPEAVTLNYRLWGDFQLVD